MWTVWNKEWGWKRVSASYLSIVAILVRMGAAFKVTIAVGQLKAVRCCVSWRTVALIVVALPIALVHGRQFLTSVSAVAVRTIQDITPWTSLTASRKNYGVKTRNAARSLDRNQSDAMARSWFVSRRYYTPVCYSFSFRFRAADE